MKFLRLASVAALILSTVVACESTDGGRKKKKPRPPLPGESESDLPWSRPTRSTDMVNPFGLPASR
ncbi:MAG: hypothetical protein EOP86_06920 [Verrucomicrobiaceae bacterium]|nr:MAG: hypothetical protein EOP86_06920 [Verrucomicrobiaceae bacterium]